MTKPELRPEARMADEGKRETEKKVAERKRLTAILYALRAIRKALSEDSKDWALSPNDQESKPYSKSGLINRLRIADNTRRLFFPQVYNFLNEGGFCREESITNPRNRREVQVHYVLCPAKLNAELEGLIKKLEETLESLSVDKKSEKAVVMGGRPPEKTPPKQADDPLRGLLTERGKKEIWRTHHQMYAEDRPDTESIDAEKIKSEKKRTTITKALQGIEAKLSLDELWLCINDFELFPTKDHLSSYLNTLIRQNIVGYEKRQSKKSGVKLKINLYFLLNQEKT